jgi:hypothetical protein
VVTLMALLDDTFALIMRNKEMIGSIIPDVVVEETYEDRLAITQHPVESGATVSDHAYMQPRTVEMRIGWSDSTGRSVASSRDSYDALLGLQKEREPFTVFTGKRIFDNMLVAGVTVINDQKTKHAIIAAVRLQEVIIVGVKTGAANQANPSKTQGTTNVGQAQAQASSREGGARDT